MDKRLNKLVHWLRTTGWNVDLHVIIICPTTIGTLLEKHFLSKSLVMGPRTMFEGSIMLISWLEILINLLDWNGI